MQPTLGSPHDTRFLSSFLWKRFCNACVRKMNPPNPKRKYSPQWSILFSNSISVFASRFSIVDSLHLILDTSLDHRFSIPNSRFSILDHRFEFRFYLIANSASQVGLDGSRLGSAKHLIFYNIQARGFRSLFYLKA